MNLLPNAIRQWLAPRKAANTGGDIATIQREGSPQGPWTPMFSGFEPRKVDPHVYESLRESIGVLDAAIHATVVLDGIVRVQGGNDAIVAEIEDFIGNVPVNDAEVGLQAAFECQGNERYEQGFGIVEWITDKRGRDIVGLRVADSKGICFRRGDAGLETWYRPISVRQDGTTQLDNIERLLRNRTSVLDPQTLGGYGYKQLDPARLLYTVNQPEADGPYGTSLLRSLEFNGKTLLTLQNAIDRTWNRFGDPPLLVVYKTANRKVVDTAGELDRRRDTIADNLRKTMEGKAAGNSVDMVQAIGKDDDFTVAVIGAGGQVLELEMPARHLLEQIVAKTQLPPWMLGLQFSTSERMAEQQAGIALQASKTRWVRREPSLRNLVATMLRLRGRTWKKGDWTLVQELPNIQDKLKEAQAGFLIAQTEMMRAGTTAAVGNAGGNGTNTGSGDQGKPPGIDNNLRSMPAPIAKHAPHAHTKAAGDDGEPWADGDPELPRLERAAVDALLVSWSALLEDLRTAVGIAVDNVAPWVWKLEHVFAANTAGEGFLGEAASETGPVASVLIDTWRRAAANAAAELGNASPKRTLDAAIAAGLRERGMSQVRSTFARVYRDDIVALLASGALDGLPAASVARDLARRFGNAAYDWQRLVSSEMVAAYGPAKLAEFAANGVERYDWSTAGDGSVCTICAGHRDAGPYVIGAGPVPMTDSHPFCRCTPVPAL